MWSIDRFNARKGNKLTEARLRVPYESHSTSDSKALLDIINHDKLLAGEIICDAIEGSWIGYANAMGLEYHEYGSTESRQILTLRDLRLALKQLSLRERLAAVYFVTGYARDVLHAQVMWGATHQAAVEDYVMDIFGIITTNYVLRRQQYLVPSTCYQVLGTRYLVPSTWHQVLGTKSWYQILVT